MVQYSLLKSNGPGFSTNMMERRRTWRKGTSFVFTRNTAVYSNQLQYNSICLLPTNQSPGAAGFNSPNNGEQFPGLHSTALQLSYYQMYSSLLATHPSFSSFRGLIQGHHSMSLKIVGKKTLYWEL